MSSCAPDGQSNQSTKPHHANPWLLIAHLVSQGGWAANTSTTTVGEHLVDEELPLHPGLSGVVAVFEEVED